MGNHPKNTRGERKEASSLDCRSDPCRNAPYFRGSAEGSIGAGLALPEQSSASAGDRPTFDVASIKPNKRLKKA